MPVFEIESGGKTYDVEAATPEAAWKVLAAARPAPARPGPIEGLTQQALNIPESATKFAGDVAHMVGNPRETLSNMQSALHGGLQHLMPETLGEKSSLGQSDYAKHSRDVATAYGQHYKGRYGSLDAALNTAITDPVGMLADVSGIGGLTRGAARAAASATRGALPGATRALEGVANVGEQVAGFDPVMMTVRGVPQVARGAGNLGAEVLGATTGVGGDAVRQSFRSGLQGAGDFWEGLQGRLNPAEHIRRANEAIDTYRRELDTQFGQDTRNMSAINPHFDSNAALNAWTRIHDETHMPLATTGGAMQTLVEGEATRVNQILTILNNFIANPNLHNFNDAVRLRRAIDKLYVDDPKFKHSNTAVAIAKDAFNNEMQRVKPGDSPALREARQEFQGANQRYSTAIEEVKQWEQIMKSYSSADNAQFSAMFNAGRSNPANALRAQQFQNMQRTTGVDLASGLAGMQMSPPVSNFTKWGALPLAGGAAAAAHFGGPALGGAASLASTGLLAASSPKLVGATGYGAGRVAGLGRDAARGAAGLIDPRVLAELRNLPPEVLQALLQAAYQTSRGAPPQ